MESFAERGRRAMLAASIAVERDRRAQHVAERLASALEPVTQPSRPRTRAQVLTVLALAGRPRPRARSGVAASASGARLELYDEIGLWGLPAEVFIQQLRDIDTDSIDLHINSPGGDVFDAVAIFNALRDHPAAVTVTVDGLAASAASFVAMAGDTVVMNRASHLMIHDAHTVVAGNEEDFLKSAELLGKVSDTLAGIYAARAGGTAAEWRERMRAETWFDAEQAVDARLADVAIENEPVDDVAAFASALRGAFR